MTAATMSAPKAVISIMPADISLAIFASCRHSRVIKSVMDSMAVLIISADNPKTIVKTRIRSSIRVTVNHHAPASVNTESTRCTRKFGCVWIAHWIPPIAVLSDI